MTDRERSRIRRREVLGLGLTLILPWEGRSHGAENVASVRPERVIRLPADGPRRRFGADHGRGH